MPRLKNRLPRMYRDRGRAYVKINGKRLRLGPWGSDEAEEEYRRLMAEWVANGRRLPAATIQPTVEESSITEVFVEYLREARNRYDERDLAHVRAALKAVRLLYGSEPASSFGPKRLRVVRQQMIDAGLARRTINKRVNWIRTAFKWAASHELCDERVHRRLATVPGLRQDEGGRETERVRPVPRRAIRLARRQMTRPVRGLVNLQLLTGARAGELVGLRATDIDTSGRVWTFKPVSHKTARHGHERTIYFGPRAQRVLRVFMRPGRLDRPLFSPRDAMAETVRRRRVRGPGRRPGQTPGVRRSQRKVGEAYDVAAYRRAIYYACDRAWPPPAQWKRIRVPGRGRKARSTRWETDAEWRSRIGAEAWSRLRTWRGDHRWHPHQLRHNAATFLRRQFGIEVASIILGHRSLAITGTYAEQNHKRAIEVMSQVG